MMELIDPVELSKCKRNKNIIAKCLEYYKCNEQPLFLALDQNNPEVVCFCGENSDNKELYIFILVADGKNPYADEEYFKSYYYNEDDYNDKLKKVKSEFLNIINQFPIRRDQKHTKDVYDYAVKNSMDIILSPEAYKCILSKERVS